MKVISSMRKQYIALLLLAALLLTGCGKILSDSDVAITPGNALLPEPATQPPVSEAPAITPEPTTEPTPEPVKYEFNPHLYVPLLAEDVPQDYWESFYNLCDALRAGETAFACSSEEAYLWATDPVTLTELFPAACMKITSESSDGSLPFENGVGRIYYQMPIDEFVQRQAQFEALVVEVLNTHLEADDDAFEKCLKLLDYMSVNYSYNYDFIENMPDGANYTTIMTGKGQCVELASVYAYFLLQAGVEAMQIGCNNESISHAWTYIVIDGNGYHSDPTWSLRKAGEDGPVLSYFLMNDDRRAATGCALDDLTAPLLPRFWASYSSVVFAATDDSYCFPLDSFLLSMDEQGKCISYSSDGDNLVFQYAPAS